MSGNQVGRQRQPSLFAEAAAASERLLENSSPPQCPYCHLVLAFDYSVLVYYCRRCGFEFHEAE